MIVWGGQDNQVCDVNTRGRYNPSTDSWTATSTTNAPSAREFHTAVWTGSEMIVWGGGGRSFSSDVNTGGRYNPSTDTWTATSTINTPSARAVHTAVWTGSEMVVWGGMFYDGTFHYLNTGGRYNPSTNTWTASNTTNAPDARINHTAVWTGSEMIVWGGAPDVNFGDLNTGGRYNPSTNTWIATSTTNAPDARPSHTAVWTGHEMIVWGGGGQGDKALNTGGRYNPSTNTWIATSTINAPNPRIKHTAVWTGSEMIAWGGLINAAAQFDSGGRYNPSANTWTATSTTNAPGGRANHTAVWTGSQMIVWGGYSNFNGGPFPTGGRYCAAEPTPSANNLGNISTRLRVETGDNVLIGGFIVTGTQPKKVIVRAIGPSLTAVGVPGALGNPILELHGSSGLIASNDNWMDAPNRQEIIDTGLAPANDSESAVLVTLPANNSNYTAIARGVNNTTGVGLVEAYDLNTGADSKLANISTRGFVQTGDNVMIGGLIITGTGPTKAVIRAIGPSLGSVGVQGALQDPSLELHDGNGVIIRTNDDWQSGANIAELQSDGLAPSDPRESAILQVFSPGAYTAIVRGVGDTTGVALVEVYQLTN
jgi:N-acetylneuraminic acid mutarotase